VREEVIVTATSTYLIVFRILHVMGGIAWGGSIFLLVFFLQPTAKAVGPAAGPFMGELLGKRRLTNVVLWIAGGTIVGGAFLYWHDAQIYGGLGDFLGETFGVILTGGSLSAIAAFLLGLLATKPTIERSLALGAQIRAAGDPPPAELVAQLQSVQARARRLAKTNFALVALAALAMATARYW
jgi:hypothetical protein